MQKIILQSCSSMKVLCTLWLLTVCVAPGSRGQQPRQTVSDQPQVHLGEREAICHQEGCYAVFLQKKSFRDAGRSCRERSGTLATMHTHEAASVVHELLSAIEAQESTLKLRLWIGLHRPPRQCSSNRPLRGFVWVTGDQDGQFTNWYREESSVTCAGPRCVAVTVPMSESGQESKDNFKWTDGSCSLALDGYVCQYNFKGMCSPLQNEGGGPAIYTTPFQLVSTLLTFIPYGSVATVPCPADSLDSPGEQTVLCMIRDDETVGWSIDTPICSSNEAPQSQDFCNEDHGCEQYCQTTDTDYYCYCSEGFVVDEDGFSCKIDPESLTDPTELSSDSAGTTDQPDIKEVCIEMGCEYNCMETARGIRCTCPPGYQMSPDGRRCSDVDECQQQPCPQQCVNAPGIFHCTCHQGYQPDDEGECVDIDECLDENSCYGLCENTVGSYNCLCNPGLELASKGVCIDIDECEGTSPCHQNCLNFFGGYRCSCDTGYDLQPDGLNCQLSNDDGEYSTMTPDLSDFSELDNLWSSSFTPNPNFEDDSNIEWDTDAPEGLSPGKAQKSDNHLNQWDDFSPRQHQTDPSPTQKGSIGNEIDNKAKMRNEEHGDEMVAGTANISPGAAGEAKMNGPLDMNTTAEFAAGSNEGKRKHDKSWLLVALLVPLCVFLVVMLALGIVYCTSCAVDKSFNFSDCYRWVLPTTPPDRRDGKNQA